jgi:proline dehydrogenase
MMMSSMVANPAAQVLPLLPKSFVWRFARRYVSGSTVDDAARTISALEARGCVATLDVLGEESTSRKQVNEVVAEYDSGLATVAERHPDSTLSVRITAFGARFDEPLCWAELLGFAQRAAGRGVGITIDMEDSTTVDQTFDLYRRLRAEGLDNVGIVLQSYLRRTLGDVRDLAALKPRVRVVKGIWIEPYAVAFNDFETIRRNYVHVLDRLMQAGSYVEIATHDEWLAAAALELIDRHGLPPDRYEFQLLLGVREELADVLVSEGHRVRVYVPYGQRWWEYCLRRLRENPQMTRHVLNDSVRSLRSALITR